MTGVFLLIKNIKKYKKISKKLLTFNFISDIISTRKQKGNIPKELKCFII